MKKTILLTVAVLVSTLTSQAVIYSTNWNSGFVNGQTVPDGSWSGWTDTRTVNTMPSGDLQAVAVTLSLNSGWTGDLFAYLVHDSGFCVLLDRVGGGASGSGNMIIRLADDGFGSAGGFSGGGDFANIHTYGGGNTSLTTWNPDNAVGGILPPAGSGSLGSFTSASGTWTLFIADVSGGGVTGVQDWGLQMDIVAVPEVETWIAAALAGAFGAFWVNRQIWGPKKSEEV